MLQVVLLLANAPVNPLAPSDLSVPSQLLLKVHSREKGANEQKKLLEVDLKPLVSSAAAGCVTALSNGHQTMIIGALYTVRTRLVFWDRA